MPKEPVEISAGEVGSDGSNADGREQAARNQLVFREVNERIAELNERNQSDSGIFICECSDPACAVAIEITAEEYEAVREEGARFVVVSGHQIPELERVVDGNDRFLVVEKVGAAGEIAHADDPRER
jgi:hypothetical protein